ncbi:meiotic nuclear division protein 1 homolog isoform X2 [Opisthocomus hoazin]|uniref:meiotic nuclear division protein 1 homolog isoform X2 n=1 Tax=Opisthocomus hoazin TaxID=30419 RepID=UPI003F534CB0
MMAWWTLIELELPIISGLFQVKLFMPGSVNWKNWSLSLPVTSLMVVLIPSRHGSLLRIAEMTCSDLGEFREIRKELHEYEKTEQVTPLWPLLQKALVYSLHLWYMGLDKLLGFSASSFAESSQKKEALQKSIEKSKIGREDTAERAALIEELAALRQKKEQLKAEIDKYRECDPDVVEEMRQTNKVAKEAANRWTDNIFSIKSWAKRKFGFEESRIDKSFGIPEDLDYID